MKHTNYISLLCLFSVVLPIQGQNRLEGTQLNEPEALKLVREGDLDTKGETPDLAESDTGAQRPVFLKKNGFSAFFGYDTKYSYQSNPFVQPNSTKTELATGFWKNTFFGGAGLGVIDMDNFILTPYVGGSWSTNDYLESIKLLEDENFHTTSAYALLLAQFANGWSARAGINYYHDSNTKTDTEIMSEVYPNIGVMYAKQFSDSLQGIFDAAIGFHDNKMDSTSKYAGTDELHNFEINTYYSFDKKIGRLHLIPKYKVSFKDYENGDNSNRSEFLHNASIALNFVFSESVKLSASYLYTVRDATGNENDYSSYDVGGGLTLTVRF